MLHMLDYSLQYLAELADYFPTPLHLQHTRFCPNAAHDIAQLNANTCGPSHAPKCWLHAATVRTAVKTPASWHASHTV